MSQIIKMEKWPSLLGVTLRIQHEYGGSLSVISLDGGDIDNLMGQLTKWKEDPSPWKIVRSGEEIGQ